MNPSDVSAVVVLTPQPASGAVGIAQLIGGTPTLLHRTPTYVESWAGLVAFGVVLALYHRRRFAVVVDIDAVPPGQLDLWRDPLAGAVAAGAQLVGHAAAELIQYAEVLAHD